MSENGCVAGSRISDVEFFSTFFPKFETLSEREKSAAVDVIRALTERSRVRRDVDSKFLSNFHQNFKKLEEREQEVVVDVTRAFINKLCKERGRRGSRKHLNKK